MQTQVGVYPEKILLKSKLKNSCANDELCEKIAGEFAGKKISCNHRAAQRTAFEVGSKLKNVKEDDIAKCTEVLCNMVDSNNCQL